LAMGKLCALPFFVSHGGAVIPSSPIISLVSFEISPRL
jgi:hypothetical protein